MSYNKYAMQSDGFQISIMLDTCFKNEKNFMKIRHVLKKSIAFDCQTVIFKLFVLLINLSQAVLSAGNITKVQPMTLKVVKMILLISTFKKRNFLRTRFSKMESRTIESWPIVSLSLCNKVKQFLYFFIS